MYTRYFCWKEKLTEKQTKLITSPSGQTSLGIEPKVIFEFLKHSPHLQTQNSGKSPLNWFFLTTYYPPPWIILSPGVFCKGERQ